MPQTLTETRLNLESQASPPCESGFHLIQKRFMTAMARITGNSFQGIE
jgi:hypothetical protein